MLYEYEVRKDSRKSRYVLILILMEYALRVFNPTVVREFDDVLILILMELLYEDSAGAITYASARTVLILILMEYALRDLAELQSQKCLLVLILILMEYALRATASF